MLRRLWFSVLLSLCLLFSQQGALLHELGHLGKGHAGLELSASGQHAAMQASPYALAAPAATELCGTCLAYVQMASALPAPWHALELGTQRPLAFLAIFFVAYSVPVPPASIRGPPAFL